MYHLINLACIWSKYKVVLYIIERLKVHKSDLKGVCDKVLGYRIKLIYERMRALK